MNNSESPNEAYPLKRELIEKSEAINVYARSHEGEYADRKTTLMLGRLATAYSHIPVFVNAAPVILPTPEGVDYGMGEVTGSIVGFTYMELPEGVEPWDSAKEGVVMQLSLPKIHDTDSPDASWRLNVLPEEMRNLELEGYIVGIPLTEGQKIIQLGDKKEQLSPEAFINPEKNTTEYSYRNYVDKINLLTGGKPLTESMADVAKTKALYELTRNMVMECPYLGGVIVVKSDYIRQPKPNSDSYQVGEGTVFGVLRKFIHGVYEDVKTKESISDTMAVIYKPIVATMIANGQMTPQEADTLPSTMYVPLSRQHALYEVPLEGEPRLLG